MSLLAAASPAPGGAPEQSIAADAVDHVVLLVPSQSPARFLGPDLYLRAIRYSVDKARSPEEQVQGTMTFGRPSALQKKLRALGRKGQEFELVIYVLVGDDLEQLRFLGVKVIGSEKNTLEWTAASLGTQRVRANIPRSPEG